jgi:hypothetical protein
VAEQLLPSQRQTKRMSDKIVFQSDLRFKSPTTEPVNTEIHILTPSHLSYIRPHSHQLQFKSHENLQKDSLVRENIKLLLCVLPICKVLYFIQNV